jgi:hypothetical protein
MKVSGDSPTADPAQTTLPVEAVTEQSSHKAQTPASESESSPHRPAKKVKSNAVVSSDEESGESKNVARAKVGATKTRGTRQPIKRGAKRF